MFARSLFDKTKWYFHQTFQPNNSWYQLKGLVKVPLFCVKQNRANTLKNEWTLLYLIFHKYNAKSMENCIFLAFWQNSKSQFQDFTTQKNKKLVKQLSVIFLEFSLPTNFKIEMSFVTKPANLEQNEAKIWIYWSKMCIKLILNVCECLSSFGVIFFYY